MTWQDASKVSFEGRTGYAFHKDDGVWGIDLDDCIASDGTLHPIAKAVVEAADTYTERSISGKGLKLWLMGKPPNGLPCRWSKEGQAIEVYSHGRFFLTTFDQWTPRSVVRKSSAAEALLRDLAPVRNLPVATSKIGSTATPMDLCLSHPPAISGSNGHGTTFSLAKKLAKQNLNQDEILFFLATYYNPRCTPRWSNRELQHKAQQAIKTGN